MFRRMTRERYLSDAELAAFMRAVRERRHVHQPRDYAFFSLLANTGIRPSEAMRLTRGDVRMGAAKPWIWVKRDHPRHAPEAVQALVIHKDVATIVRNFISSLPDDDKARRLFPFTKRQSARLYHYYAHKAQVNPPRKIYALRHTAGRRMLQHTGDLRLVQAIMGHVRLKATSVYLDIDPTRLFSAQSTLECI
jgi:integrase